jgi:hypothetical protein
MTQSVRERAYKFFCDNLNDCKPCERCASKGYHHGFGEDGMDPDWCVVCGGCGFVSKFKNDSDAFSDALDKAGILFNGNYIFDSPISSG